MGLLGREIRSDVGENNESYAYQEYAPGDSTGCKAQGLFGIVVMLVGGGELCGPVGGRDHFLMGRNRRQSGEFFLEEK